MDGAAKLRVTCKIQAPGISIEADSTESAEKLFNDYSVHQLKVEIEQTKRIQAKEATLKAAEEAKKAAEETKKAAEEAKKAVEESIQLQLRLELAKIQSKSSETPKTSGPPKPSETAEPSGPPTPSESTSEPSVQPKPSELTSETLEPVKLRKRVWGYEDIAVITGNRFPSAKRLKLQVLKPACLHELSVGKIYYRDDNGVKKRYKAYSCTCGDRIRIRVVNSMDSNVYTVQRSNEYVKHANGKKVVAASSDEEP